MAPDPSLVRACGGMGDTQRGWRQSMKRGRRATGTWAAVVAMALIVGGCDERKKTPPIEAASASAGPAAGEPPKPPPKPPFQDLVAKSEPLSPTPQPVTVAEHTLTAKRCRLEGASFLHESPMKVLSAVEVSGDKAYLVDPEGVIHGFAVEPGESCVWKVDESFGKAGKLKLDKPVKALSHAGKGRLVASTQVFGHYVLQDGKVAYRCEATGVVRVSPGGDWGIGSYANSRVRKIAYGADGCEASPWVIRDLSKPKTRRGPLSNVNAVGFVGKHVLVGGVLADKVQNRQPKVVVAYDGEGEEVFRIGNTDPTAREDSFGWIHGIAPCQPGICVLDSNYRRLTVWKKDGMFLGNVKLSKLFGLRYPWVPDLRRDKDVLYFVVGQDRGSKSGVAEGLVFRVTMKKGG